MKSIKACRRRCGYLGAVVLAYSLTPFAATTDEVIGVGEKRVAEGAAAQKQVEKISDHTKDLAFEYKQVTKLVDGLNVYNDLLHKQVDNQLAEIVTLTDSIGKVSLIERQIMPLMVRMIDSFEEFVRLDVPFLAEERGERLQRLRAMMERSDVTAAEKFRLVLEAYQIEGEYGRTIEAYRGSLDVGGGTREVNFLRVGRVALLFQTDGGDITGAWDVAAGTWVTLSPEQYKQDVARGLRVARKQLAPDLLVLPVAAPKGPGQ